MCPYFGIYSLRCKMYSVHFSILLLADDFAQCKKCLLFLGCSYYSEKFQFCICNRKIEIGNYGSSNRTAVAKVQVHRVASMAADSLIFCALSIKLSEDMPVRTGCSTEWQISVNTKSIYCGRCSCCLFSKPFFFLFCVRKIFKHDSKEDVKSRSALISYFSASK